MVTVMFVGHGRAGKDTAAGMFSEITGMKNAGSTSKYLLKEVAKRLNRTDLDQVYAERHANRKFWYDVGNELRESGPSTLIRQALKHGNITAGVRDMAEITAVREEHLIDLIVWIENERVPADPTVMFTSADADIVILNNGSLDHLFKRLERLAHAMDLEPEEVTYSDSEDDPDKLGY